MVRVFRIIRFCCVRSVERSWVGVVGVRGVEPGLGVCRGVRDLVRPVRGGAAALVLVVRLLVVRLLVVRLLVVRLLVGCEVVVCSGRRIPVSRSFGICWRVTSERAVVLCGQVSARAVVCGLVCVCGCELLCVECVGGARSAGIAGVA